MVLLILRKTSDFFKKLQNKKHVFSHGPTFLIIILNIKFDRSHTRQLKKLFPKQVTGGGLTVRQDKKCFWDRVTMKVGALQSPELGASFRYLEHMCMTSRKFFRGLWSQKNASKTGRNSEISTCFQGSEPWNFWKFSFFLQ